MPRKVRAAGCAVNTLSTNLTHQYRGLWITDALLEETFQRFCHSSRRYGSNIPGPLEARRRASKRRNTNLAYASIGGQHVFDPTLMLASGTKEQWWSKYEAPNMRTKTKSGNEHGADLGTSSLLLPWFLKPPDPPTRPAFERKETVQADQAVVDVERLRKQFRYRISHTMDLMGIQQVINDTKVDFRQFPQLSEVVFRQTIKICDRNGCYDQLTPALCDPYLNPPGSNNHLNCIRHICSGHVSRKTWETQVLLPLLKAVELGLVSTHDLQEIILLLPEARKDMPVERAYSKVHNDWHRLLTSIEQSRVLQLDDLDHNFLSQWYNQILDAPQTDTTCLLLWRLRRYSNCAETELASRLTVKRLTDLSEDDDGGLEKLISWLKTLPADLQWSNVVQTTFSLIGTARDDPSHSQRMLEKWSELLPRIQSRHLKAFPIDQAAWAESAIVSGNLTSSEQLLSALWVAVRLWSACSDATDHFNSTKLRDHFEIVFQAIDDVPEFDRISQIVLALDMLPLPEKDQIFSHLQYFSDEELIKLLGHQEYTDGLKACFRLEYAQLRNHHLVKQAKHNYPQVLTALAESINTDLAQFQAMAQTLVLKSNENYRVVKRLLDHNLKLKFALCRSWDADVNVDQTHPEIDKASVLDMVEKLIVTFSVTPVVSPRASFKYVSKMYSFLHKVGAPIRPIVGRALWHAGVTRYGQAGAPHAQVSWCLAKVREIEGDIVAGQLLRSAGFRRAFVQNYADTVRKTAILARKSQSSSSVNHKA